MYNFNFSIPTEIYFGDKVQEKAGALMKTYAEKVLLLYGSERIFKEGLGVQLTESLKAAGCQVLLLGGVKPNAETTFIDNAIELVRRENIEGILAVGGGSVIDTAKAISAGASYSGKVAELYANPSAQPESFLPIGAVVTMPASASEANEMSVISDVASGRKIARPFKEVRPKFALLNPDLTVGISGFQTACGGFDIFAHAFERYFDLTRESVLLDGQTESLMRTVLDLLPKVLEAPEDLQLRGNLMLAATIAHSDMLGPGGDFACHELSHVITERFGITHGSALAMIIPVWCEYMADRRPERFCEFFERVWDIKGESREEVIAEGVKAMRSYIHQIGLPLSMHERNVDLPSLVKEAGTPGGGFAKLTPKDVEAIFKKVVA